MNICIFCGKILEIPELKKDGDSIYTSLLLEVESFRYRPSLGKKVRETVEVVCEAWDSAAENIVLNYEKGELILVHCQLKPRNKFRITEFARY